MEDFVPLRGINVVNREGSNNTTLVIHKKRPIEDATDKKPETYNIVPDLFKKMALQSKVIHNDEEVKEDTKDKNTTVVKEAIKNENPIVKEETKNKNTEVKVQVKIEKTEKPKTANKPTKNNNQPTSDAKPTPKENGLSKFPKVTEDMKKKFKLMAEAAGAETIEELQKTEKRKVSNEPNTNAPAPKKKKVRHGPAAAAAATDNTTEDTQKVEEEKEEATPSKKLSKKIKKLEAQAQVQAQAQAQASTSECGKLQVILQSICIMGKSCPLINEPLHKRQMIHLNKPVCQEGKKCTLLLNAQHRAQYHHVYEWDYLKACEFGENCSLKANPEHAKCYQHTKNPIYPII